MDENTKEKKNELVSSKFTKEEFADILSQMEKLVQGKIDALKASIPIFFTVITSVIAFFFLENFKIDMNDTQQIKTWLAIFGIVLGLLCLLLIGNFSIYKYKSHFDLPLKDDFKPWNINSYIWSGDERFLNEMEKYAGYQLNENEKMRIHILKEKINEFRKKNVFMCLVHVTIIAFLALFILGIILYGASL